MRVEKEFAKSDRIDDVIVSLHPIVNESGTTDISRWTAVVTGPVETPYHGYLFELNITFGNDYPNHPPSILFTTKIWHPNISVTGEICMNLLKSNWVPRLTIRNVLLMILSMLDVKVANAGDPLNGEAGVEMEKSVALFETHAEDWCKKYAIPDNIKPTKKAAKPTKKTGKPTKISKKPKKISKVTKH